jgi:ferredoxin
MRVFVDADACRGHGRCYTLSPDAFDSDHEGHSVPKVDDVEGELLQSDRVAASNCPERAIRVRE